MITLTGRYVREIIPRNVREIIQRILIINHETNR